MPGWIVPVDACALGTYTVESDGIIVVTAHAALLVETGGEIAGAQESVSTVCPFSTDVANTLNCVPPLMERTTASVAVLLANSVATEAKASPDPLLHVAVVGAVSTAPLVIWPTVKLMFGC